MTAARGPRGGGRVCGIPIHYFCPQLLQTHLLKTGFACGKYCMYSIVCQYGLRETIWGEKSFSEEISFTRAREESWSAGSAGTLK